MIIVRYLNVLAVGALLGSAVYAYVIVKAKHDIQRESDSIGMLRAEWAHLSRPDRVQALSDKHLDLQAVTVDQMVKAGDLPDRVAKVDMIGRKLEALGMAEPTTTPRDERGPPARSATPASSR
jgi:hypothetical protein